MARRRSDNVGWGPVCRSVNRERRSRDWGDDPDREYRPRRDEGQHPNSAAFEARGRVEREDEE